MIAPLLVWRRGEDDFLLLTEPELGETVRAHLDADAVRGEVRDRARAAHLGDRARRADEGASRTTTTACRRSRCSTALDAEPADDELERLRILARTPRWGREIDEAILPAEAGLDERAISFTKGCYPGQEPLARLHNRGHVNRTLRVLELDGDAARQADEIASATRSVGRVTSAVPGLALAYVRVEVPDDAELEVAGRSARLH